MNSPHARNGNRSTPAQRRCSFRVLAAASSWILAMLSLACRISSFKLSLTSEELSWPKRDGCQIPDHRYMVKIDWCSKAKESDLVQVPIQECKLWFGSSYHKTNTSHNQTHRNQNGAANAPVSGWGLTFNCPGSDCGCWPFGDPQIKDLPLGT